MKIKKLNLREFIKKMTPSSFDEILNKEIEKYKNKRILAAFSGGKDSLSLIDFLNKKKEVYNIELSACHINHGLRDTAKRDEDFCAEYCKQNNIKIYIRNIGKYIADDNTSSVEGVARKYRYNELFRILEDDKYDYIFTAHTFSDNIENFFIDLYTGVSLYTLGGIQYNNNKIIRPMLNITTEMVNDYLENNRLIPVYDETNSSLKYVRNRVRHKLIPVLYDCGNEFESTVLNIQSESARLNNYFYKKTQYVVKNETLPVLIDRELYKNLDDLEKEYILGRIFSLYFRQSKSLILEATKFLEKNNSKRLDLPNGYMLEQSFNSIRIFHKSYVASFYGEKKEFEEELFLADIKVLFKNKYREQALIVRSRRPGDRFMNKKLKDIFIDKGIDLCNRDRAVIIERNGKIIWVEHISSSDDITIIR